MATLASCGVLVAAVNAQPAEPAAEPSATAAATAPVAATSQPAPAVDPVAGVSVSVTVAPVAAATPAAASLVGCRSVTDKAMAADLAAVTAQSKKTDLAEQSRLFNEAVSLWTQAQTQCSGHANDRAKRNRDDDLQMLDRVLEQLDSGPQCATAHKDAGSLQDIAKQALTERRWIEAAALFRKAESMWDYAAERCTGSQQEVANRRREQSAQDGHNAQYCAPLFEKARERTQKLRGAAATLSKNDKHDAQMVAETLWRDALAQCRGAAVQEIAANNANALARERGTPWVPRMAPVESAGLQADASGVATSKPVISALAPPAADVPALVPADKGAARSFASVAVQAPSTVAAPMAATLVPQTKAMPNLPPEPTAEQPGDVTAGDTRFVGRFYRDANATTISGSGTITWASGDVFEGTMVRGKRQGQGTIKWANGQHYTGDWAQDRPTGHGKMRFANGNDYDGVLVDGVPNGPGRMHYASGDTFEGQFKGGEPDQTGIYVWRNGQRYEGPWQNGRPNGVGQLKFANGNQYDGQVLDGKPQGQGRMVFATGEVYVGQLTEGQPDGLGTFSWTSGDQYVGEWKMGQKHGKGFFVWKSGERWEGVYENDVQKN